MSALYYLKTLNQLRPVLVGFCKANGLTQREMSERLGVTQQTYARHEINPTTANIERLFRVFSLLGGELVLSSKEPLSDSKPSFISKQQDVVLLPDRRNGDSVFFTILEFKNLMKTLKRSMSLKPKGKVFYQTAFYDLSTNTD